MKMSLKIGYLIPEFPGQTHAFFWREIKALEKMGVTVDVVSTRLPNQKIMSHHWTEVAQSRTTYLFPLKNYLKILEEFAHYGFYNAIKVFKPALTAENHSLKERTRLIALGIIGVEISLIARKKQWDHLHVHSCADAANIAMMANRLSGLSYSIALHGSLKDYGKNQEQKWSCASFAIVITQKLYQEVKTTISKYLPSKIRIAPMGVDNNEFTRTQPYCHYENGEILVFSCGRLNPCKGHKYLIEAIHLLQDQGFQIKLMIAGEDEEGGNGYRKTLEDLIRHLELEESVKLLGAISEIKIKENLEQAHLFALASLEEPLGVATMEAMAMEIPVVVTDAGGVRELVNHNVEGKLVKPESSAELADAIRDIVTNSDLAIRMGKAGRKKILSSFSSERSANVLLETINSLSTI